jgi:CRP/FNR family cyclic AMP-dependent transcriptional regulator
MNNVKAILSHPIFSGLNRAEAEELAKHCEVLMLPEGQIVVQQGEISEDMYVLIKGSLSIHVEDRFGEDSEVGLLSKGEVFGEMGVFENTARSASIYSKNESVVLRIPGEGFHQMVEEGQAAMHALLQHTLKNACIRLRDLDKRLDALF